MIRKKDFKKIIKQGIKHYDNVDIILPKQPEYRVGDMVLKNFWRKYGFGGVDHKTGEELTGEEYHLKYFPKSIASEYMKATTESEDFDLITSIIRKRAGARVAPGTLIVHLRVGDVIDDPAWNDKSVKDLLLHGSSFVASLAEIDAVLRCARRHGAKRIVILYGFHQQGTFRKSRIYLASVRAFCDLRGYAVELLTHSSADESLIYASTATLFARTGGGGFSVLLSRVVKANGGKVCRRPSRKSLTLQHERAIVSRR